MHEASIVRSLLETAASHVPAGARAAELRVRVGRLTAVSPDAMQFYFEVLGPEALGRQARLAVTLAPLRGRCRGCAAPFEVAEQIWLCPACGEPTLDFANGDELDLTGMVIEDGPPDHDRAEDPQEERGHRRREP
jgi:hydrogenase nickel incorporation protein HypA/HybF